MPEDLLEQIFEQIAQADVAVPPADQVLARGRQRRRRARLRVIAAALTVALAAGLGAWQLAGHMTSRQPLAKPTRSARPKLPPPGSGRLILALDGTGRFVMARVGSSAAPVAVPHLPAVDSGPSLLASNPAGGWVVTYSADPGAPPASAPARLATVSVTGHSEPFGPVFREVAVTSLAVSPDGTRVAIALLGSSGRSSGIEVRPLPGHSGKVRVWHFAPGQANDAVSLTWAPDGRRLSYIAGFQTGGGLAGGMETLDTAGPIPAVRSGLGPLAPGLSPWSPASKFGGYPKACTADAVAWLGATGRMLALEECGISLTGRGREILVPVSPRTGRPAGPAQVIARRVGCGSPGLAPTSDGSVVLVSYCGLFLDTRGRLSALRPAGLVAAAFAGFTVTAG